MILTKEELFDSEYNAFVEKFKPKKTTDDRYTPPAVYDAVAEWVSKEYGVDRQHFKRPFYPGGDYQREQYDISDIVVDNPPFSIITSIVKWYTAHDVKFFLFAPALTLFSSRSLEVCYLTTGVGIIYENGANVSTSFVSNLDGYAVRTAPDLREAVLQAQKTDVPALSKYEYPDCLLTAARGQYLAGKGIDYRVPRGEALFIRSLDAQKGTGKAIFGGGLLLTEKAAAEKAAAEKAAAEKAAAEKAAAEKDNVVIWQLSERERIFQSQIGEEYRRNLAEGRQLSLDSLF